MQHEHLIYESGMLLYNVHNDTKVQNTHKTIQEHNIAIGAIKKNTHVTITCFSAK